MKITQTTDRYLTKLDPSKRIPSRIARDVQQFRTRKEAESAARLIGWSTCDAIQIDVMGFQLWAIVDPHMNAVTRDGFMAWGGR